MLSVFRNRRLFHLMAGKWGYLLAASIMMTVAGCTSIGHSGAQPDMDMGPRVELRVGIYRDVNISGRQAAGIIAAIQKEFAQYGLNIQVPSIREWQRPSFKHQGILRDIAERPLEPPVDRILALVGRDMGDFLWGSLLPEVLGAVETRTHTKGYVVAEIGSLNQLLTFKSPRKAAVHEFYHMLGIDHMDGKRTINKKISRLKSLAIENRNSGRDFFPGIGANGNLYLSRNAVNHQFGWVPENTTASLTNP